MRTIRMVIAGALVAVLASCGLEPASQAVPEVEPGEELAEFDSLDGAPIVTTSKDFTEQLVLGRMLSLVLRAQDAEVSDQTNAKGSFNARESLVSGGADVMVEYTGTAWISYLGHAEIDPETGLSDGIEIADPEAVYDEVKKEDAANGIHWGPTAPFNNTYAMAVKAEDAERLDLEKLSDIADLPPEEQTFCLENEFQNRADGWPGLKKSYDIDSSVTPTIMDTGIIYSKIGSTCVLGEVFDTDGRIPANDLVTLEDDKGYFPYYEPAVNVRSEIHDEYPQIAEIFGKIGQKLDTEVMRDLNARVDVDGQDPLDVARDWLTEEGFLAQE